MMLWLLEASADLGCLRPLALRDTGQSKVGACRCLAERGVQLAVNSAAHRADLHTVAARPKSETRLGRVPSWPGSPGRATTRSVMLVSVIVICGSSASFAFMLTAVLIAMASFDAGPPAIA